MWTVFASKALGFAKAIPGWVWWVVVAIAFGKFIDMRARADQQEKDKAREAANTIKTVQKIKRTSEHEAQVAIQAGANAPRLPPDGNTHGLPESVQSRVFRD